jgi:hypothetical protein
MCTSEKCIAVREIVKDWMGHHAANQRWTINDNLTAERLITVTVDGVAERLELRNDEQIGGALKREVEDWLAKQCRT